MEHAALGRGSREAHSQWVLGFIHFAIHDIAPCFGKIADPLGVNVTRTSNSVREMKIFWTNESHVGVSLLVEPDLFAKRCKTR